MNGILIIDKQSGFTSHDVVAKTRKILQTKRIGHTGTLDPFATGVMVILVGHATRLAQFLDKDVKEYIAEIALGFETDTGDFTGSPKSEVQSPKSEIHESDIEAVLENFRGEQMQTPPMYSAKKVDGKKLYELARKGVEIERKSVKINISKLELIENRKPKTENRFEIRVAVSAGTYIRVLAEDIGRKLGIGAHLTGLRRTRAGNFDLSQAVTLQQLTEQIESNELGQILITPNDSLKHLPQIILNENDVSKTFNGNRIFTPNATLENENFVRMCDETGNLIAVGIYDADDKSLQPKVVLKENNW
ncbi:MAG: tRNA pseudouridine(55) synthase TruB [Pyrinomonadaceae bacterium]|nr:tRNA pseudouridine(55) synthase TruB [Pyrinomonadaceae bacterium]